MATIEDARKEPVGPVLPDLSTTDVLASEAELDTATASGQEEEQDDDAQSIIAVSMSRAQSRLISPRTPAAEKAAALQNLSGGGLFDSFGLDGQGSGSCKTSTLRQQDRSGSNGGNGLPSPWRASPKSFETACQADPASQRKRAGSASIFGLPDLNLKRLMPFSVSSLPKVGNVSQLIPSLFSSSSAPWNDKDSPSHNRTKRASTLFSSPLSGWNTFTSPNFTRSFPDQPEKKSETLRRPQSAVAPMVSFDDTYVPENPRKAVETSGPHALRRATSDESLYITRSISRVSSLGDDSKFEDIQTQVNSRFKALKDSFADSSFKIQTRRLPHQQSKTRHGYPTGADSQMSNTDSNDKGRWLKFPSVSAAATEAVAESPTEYLYGALENLTGDVVVLGGYRGSILRSAKPPHRQLWAPVKVGLNLRKVDLEVGLTSEDENAMEQNIISSGMLTHIGPVDISRRLLRKLRHCENARKGLLRVWDYGYDWRLSPHLLSDKFRDFLARLPCNQSKVPLDQQGATILAHSLGGLITRHAVNRQPSLFRGILYAGVPQSCVNILGPLRNGDEVLLSSKVLTAQVNFTLRTSYVLLPESGHCFCDKTTMKEYPIDFFDVNTWVEYHLSPCIRPALSVNEPGSTLISGLLGNVASSLPSLAFPGSRTSVASASVSPNEREQSESLQGSSALDVPKSATQPEKVAGKVAQTVEAATDGTDATLAPQLGNNPGILPSFHSDTAQSAGIKSTIPLPDALEYLDRTLKQILQFKKELHHNPALEAANTYPPVTVLYGKTVPTVRGAKVAGREGIKYDTAYDDLIFGSGDGVVLAKQAMLPAGYRVARGGRVSSERGHVTLLGDLEGVGRCLKALTDARKQGIGLGAISEPPSSTHIRVVSEV
ncbi:MAG: hypothetical protein M1814_000417 [Vezdaea aestivalis]|nr:MAG: hypothetical protein M1814_000417 [Vezdaea aestivalis]